MSRLFLIFSFILSISIIAESSLKLKELKLNFKTAVPSGGWILDEKPIYKGPENYKSAAEMMMFERKQDFLNCSIKGREAFEKIPEFRGWIAIEALNCIQILSPNEKNRKAELFKWVGLYQTHRSVFLSHIQFEKVQSQMVGLILESLGSAPMSTSEEKGLLLWLSDRKTTLTREERAQFFKFYGLYLETVKPVRVNQAIEYYLRAQDLGIASQVRDRLSALGWKKEESVRELDASSETALFQKVDELLGANNLTLGFNRAVEFFQKYPGSSKAQGLSERVVNIVSNLFERSERSDQLDKFLSILAEAPKERIVEWARIVHRKGDYQSAQFLAREALKGNDDRTEAAGMLYVLGRTSHFLGDYKTAQSAFVTLLERHSSYSEAAEVRFRLGLIKIRLEDFASAELHFRGLIDKIENKIYDLPSRYWLIRLMQKQNKDASAEISQLLEKYYLSYYGLLLAAEKNKGTIEWTWKEPALSNTQLYLTDSEFQSWNKAQALSQAGMLSAASEELKNLYVPMSPEGRLNLARKFSEYFSFPMAIRLLNEAIDLDTSFRQPEIVSYGFPFPFKKKIETEALKNRISPYLVVSLIRQESAFLLKATSKSQAQGLMQMIPATAKEIADDLNVKTFKPTDIYSPELNIQFGTHYINKMIRRFDNNVPVALAAYNAGPHRMKRFFEGRPSIMKTNQLSQSDPWSDLWVDEVPWNETSLYVKAILRNSLIYQILDRKKVEFPSPVWGPLVIENSKIFPAQK